MTEKELIIDIKEVVLLQSYLCYSDISLKEIENITWHYVKKKYKHKCGNILAYEGDNKLQELAWQIAVNIAYHLVKGNFIVFNSEPEVTHYLKDQDKNKWRIDHYIKPLTTSHPDKFGQDDAWWQYFEITSFCEEFMRNSDDESTEIANENFYKNIIDYFKIVDLTKWVEKPILVIDKTKILIEEKDRF